MIIPSIDISAGTTVQLVGGEDQALDAGDPIAVMRRLSLAGEVAVVDIDAARGEGSNAGVIRELCKLGPVRVGGGIRDVETAVSWLDAGAERVIVGTAAEPEFLARLPRERVIVALDSRDGHVVTHGWRRSSNKTLLDEIARLRDVCSGFLVTFVEREGRLAGTDLERARAAVAAAGGTEVTVAGGITSIEEIRSLDEMGADAQVGMALYTGQMSLAEAVTAPLRSDRGDGLWPTVVVDEDGVALGLAYSSMESLTQAMDTGQGVYQSRSRGLWVKGETSGASQRLLGVDVDCDRDTLRFTVRQNEGFCHRGTRTCWGEDHGLSRLERRLEEIAISGAPGNTSKLLQDPLLLADKIEEEAKELSEATDNQEVVAEAADLLYFLLVRMVAAGVSLQDVMRELDGREKRVSRRPMVSKGLTR